MKVAIDNKETTPRETPPIQKDIVEKTGSCAERAFEGIKIIFSTVARSIEQALPFSIRILLNISSLGYSTYKFARSFFINPPPLKIPGMSDEAVQECVHGLETLFNTYSSEILLPSVAQSQHFLRFQRSTIQTLLSKFLSGFPVEILKSISPSNIKQLFDGGPTSLFVDIVKNNVIDFSMGKIEDICYSLVPSILGELSPEVKTYLQKSGYMDGFNECLYFFSCEKSDDGTFSILSAPHCPDNFCLIL